jgi:hypothetical protein
MQKMYIPVRINIHKLVWSITTATYAIHWGYHNIDELGMP